MSLSNPDEAGESKERSLHPVMMVIGVIATAATALLATRLAWEMTSLTWQEGPQMVGFSLIHGYGVFLIFAPCYWFFGSQLRSSYFLHG
jgi:hypothetical protein